MTTETPPSSGRRPVPWRRWLVLVWVLALGGILGAQAQAFRCFDHRDGLPQSQVSALLEDRDGFLWVGTGDALARMGASGFQVFGAGQGLKCRNVGSLLQDRRGSIWVAGSGLSEVRGSAITNYGPDQGLLVDDVVYGTEEDARGDLYAGTRMGLFRKAGDRFAQVPLPGNWFYAPIFAMAFDGSGGLWLGSRAGGSVRGNLARWDGSRLLEAVLPEPFKGRSILAIRRDAAGVLWAISPLGLLRLDAGQRWTQVPLEGLEPSAKPQNLHLGPQGELAISLGLDGLYLRDARGRGHRMGYQDGLPQYPVLDALRDRNGNLWVGLDGGGLLASATPGLRSLAYNPGTGLDLGLGTLLHFLEEAPGRTLLASYNGLFRWEEGRGITRRWDARRGLPNSQIWTLAPDGRHGAWIGTNGGLARLAGDHILPGPKELAGVSVGQILEHLGRLWAATAMGLAELDPDGRFIAFHRPPQEVPTASVSRLLPRPWGLLVGTELGLYTFRDGRFAKAYADAPIARQSILTLDEDARGQLWAGTLFGLYGLVGPGRTWIRMGNQAGLLNDTINWVRCLSSGTLVVGHNKGVTFVREGRSVHLTRNLGLVSDETNQDSAYLDASNRLWMGMVGGASILDLSREPAFGGLPAPRLVEATWGRHSAWLPEALSLDPNPGTVTLLFDTALPCPPAAPFYQVMLEGLDPSWRSLEGPGKTVQIAHLAPGTYRFRIRASIDGSTWVESSPVTLQVRRAWYQTFLARGLGLLLAAGLLAGAVQLRVLQLKQRNLRLERKVTERTEALALRNKSLERLHHQLKRNLEGRIQLMRTVTHDLRSPLTSILLSVDRLSASTSLEAPLKPTLSVLERECRRLDGLLKGMLDKSRDESLTESLNQRLCRPSEVLQGLTETLRLKAEARDLESSLDLDPAMDAVWILADVTALQQVLFNLLENALKFTEGPGTVGICAGVRPGWWVLEVWDTGRGIQPDHLGLIFERFTQTREGDTAQGWGLGLNICRTMVEAHMGRIEVESEVGRGSRFRVLLPLVTTDR